MGKLKTNTAILFLAFSIFSGSIKAVTVPEGIRGLTVTYGAWIEKVLSKGILKDIIYPEDQEKYDKLQRLIITSERLSEEGNNREALSYIRKAEFYLEDLQKSNARNFGWTQKEYTAEEMKPWSRDAQETWTILTYYRISLYLQYEYYYILNHSPSEEYFTYITDAEKLFSSLNKDTKSYNRIKSTAIESYMSAIETSWNVATQNQKEFSIDKMMEKIASSSNDFLSGSGYWKRKFIKRATILLAKFGYAEKAMGLLNHLMEDKTDSLPVEVVYNLMIYNGKFSDAQKYIEDNLNTLNLNDVDNWGIYIKYKTKLLSMLLILKKYDTYRFELEKYISQLNEFIDRIDLSPDIYEYIAYQLNSSILNHSIVAKISHWDNNNKSLPKLRISEFTPPDIIQKKEILESYDSGKFGSSLNSIAEDYRRFQISLELKDPKISGNLINSLGQKDHESFLSKLALLQYKLNYHIKDTPKNWYKLWIETIYQSLNNPFELVALEDGIFLDFNFEGEFFNFLSENPVLFSNKDLGNLLYAVSLLSTWNKKTLSPPEYYRPIDYRLRYVYFARWGFQLSEEGTTNNILSMVFLEQVENQPFCQNQSTCIVLYPSDNKVYSFIFQDQTRKVLTIDENTDKLMALVKEFYSSLEKQPASQMANEKLSLLSQVFRPVLKEAMAFNGNSVYLLTYKYSSLIPMEALYLPESETHLGDIVKVIRKLPIDQAFVVSCKGRCSQEKTTQNDNPENYFFIGIGNTNPGFIISNPNLDEILDIEGLFSQKQLLSETSGLAGNLVDVLEKSQENIVHVAGEWREINNYPVLVVSNPNNGIELNNFKFMNNLPYMVFSKTKSSNFSKDNFFSWEKVLTTFRYKNTGIIITSMSLTSKEFRQAFFYDMYYKIVHKKYTWNDAFFSAMDRTKKGFPRSLWPYLMVIYEQ